MPMCALKLRVGGLGVRLGGGLCLSGKALLASGLTPGMAKKWFEENPQTLNFRQALDPYKPQSPEP